MPLSAHLSGGSIAQRAVRALGVVELPPLLDQHPRFSEIAEPLPIQALVSELAVEALHKAVLPRTPRCNEDRTDALIAQPAHDRSRRKLRALIGADELGLAVKTHDLPAIRYGP